MSVTTLARRRCPFCRVTTYEGVAWRTRLAEHLYVHHREHVRMEILDWTEDAFESMELRGTQRALLLFAIDNPRFTVEVGGDSTSLWSMAKREWFLNSADQKLRERVWTMTELGYAVARAALARSRKLGERVRHPVSYRPAPAALFGRGEVRP